MAFRVKRLDAGDDLNQICAQIKPDLWGVDNEMSSYRAEDLRRFLDGGGIAFVAIGGRDGDEVAGIAVCYHLAHPSGEDSLYIHELDAHPNFRRQGVGTAILDAALAVGEELGVVEVWLAADEGNEPAHNLYRKRGPSEVDPGTVYVYSVPRP